MGDRGDGELQLVEAHIHQAWDTILTTLAVVRPAERPAMWRVEVRGKEERDDVPTDQVAALLEEWGFVAGRWAHWPGPKR